MVLHVNQNGCVINPMNNKSMNNEKVVIRKKAIGVVAEFGGSSTETIIEGDTLVEQVCDSFKQGINTGKWGTC